MTAFEVVERGGYKTIAYAKNRYWLFKNYEKEKGRYRHLVAARKLTGKPYRYYLCEYIYQDDHKGVSYPSRTEKCARSETEAKYQLWEYRCLHEHYFEVKVSLAKHYIVHNPYDIGIRKQIGYFVYAKNRKQVLEQFPNANKIIKISNKRENRKTYEIGYRWIGSSELIVMYRIAWCEADAYDQYTVDQIDCWKDKKGIIVEYIKEVKDK